MSDLPADTLTTTIANVLHDHEWTWRIFQQRPVLVCRCGDNLIPATSSAIATLDDHQAHVAAAVVSVLATHNQHTAADALRDAADAAVPKFNVHPLNRSNTVRDWLIARADRLAAVSPTPPTHVHDWCGICDQPGHTSDGHPAPVPPTHTTTTEDQP